MTDSSICRTRGFLGIRKTRKVFVLLAFLVLLESVFVVVSDDSSATKTTSETSLDWKGDTATVTDSNEDWLSQNNETLTTNDVSDLKTNENDKTNVEYYEPEMEEIDDALVEGDLDEEERQDDDDDNLSKSHENIEEGLGSAFGVIQEFSSEMELEIRQTLENTRQYMEKVWNNDSWSPVWNLCRNQNSWCSLWTVQGECQANPDFMSTSCAPACQTCHLLHYETRCAHDPNDVDAWKPGDLNQMFERIVLDPNYNVTVISRPNYLPRDNQDSAPYRVGPWVIYIDNFLSVPETERLIYHGGLEGYERSLAVGDVDQSTGEFEDVEDNDRTSSNAWCYEECHDDPVVAQVLKRVETLTGIPVENSEHLQLLKYEVGQFYVTHHDYLEHHENALQGPRILTVFMYLNDVEEGGETRFDYFDLKVQAKAGRILLWPSVLDENPSVIDERTEHEAMPVLQGQKYAANAWLHLRNVKKALELDC